MIRALFVSLIYIAALFPSSGNAAYSCRAIFTSVRETDFIQLSREITAVLPKANNDFVMGLYQDVAFRLLREGHRGLAEELELWIQNELQHGTVVRIRPGKGEQNASKFFYVDFASGLRAIYKLGPENANRPQVAHFINPNAEIAAYIIDRLIGVGVVPTAALRSIDLAEYLPEWREGPPHGSLHAYVESVVDPRQVATKPSWRETERRIRLLDYLINNHDRHPGNILLSYIQSIAIDQGGAFQPIGKEHGRYPPLGLGKLPADARYIEIADGLRRVSERRWVGVLGKYLSASQLREFLEHRKALVAQFDANIESGTVVADHEVVMKPPSENLQLRTHRPMILPER